MLEGDSSSAFLVFYRPVFSKESLVLNHLLLLNNFICLFPFPSTKCWILEKQPFIYEAFFLCVITDMGKSCRKERQQEKYYFSCLVFTLQTRLTYEVVGHAYTVSHLSGFC